MQHDKNIVVQLGGEVVVNYSVVGLTLVWLRDDKQTAKHNLLSLSKYSSARHKTVAFFINNVCYVQFFMSRASFAD